MILIKRPYQDLTLSDIVNTKISFLQRIPVGEDQYIIVISYNIPIQMRNQ